MAGKKLVVDKNFMIFCDKFIFDNYKNSDELRKLFRELIKDKNEKEINEILKMISQHTNVIYMC